MLVPPAMIDVATHVGMGEIVFLHNDQSARAVVGSCAGLVLYHRRAKLAAVAHIVLPELAGRSGNPGKFADTAVPHMVERLESSGAPRGGLAAKLTGGARMFGGNGPLQIGDANIQAVLALLADYAIPLQSMCVGGTQGRKFTFHCQNGEMMIEVAGQSPTAL